jgi:hypothetical protein
MLKKAVIAGLFASTLAVAGFAQEGPVPKGVRHLDHVFVIMMENHGYAQIVGNPATPFANAYAKSANSATNYFAVAHPSLNNYLEVVGGSNFGIQSDNNPDWHNANCTTNLSTGVANTDNPASGLVCPIYGTGTDAAIPAIDCTNEVQCTQANPNGELNLDGTVSYPANPKTVGKTIADELSEAGGTWKSYQESLPLSGADRVDFADGFFTDTSNIPGVIPGETQTLIELYAAKHDPFVYFRSVQEGELNHVVPFSGPNGLFADLSSGHVPNYSFIAPNQCNDQHGRGNAGPQCDFDPNDNGTQNGLNPALMSVGDQALESIVNAIHGSSVWHEGRNVIIVIWDENDYSVAPINNRVLAIVDTNYGPRGVTSNKFYTHFSLLKSVEGALGLPCLNHACDSTTHVMSDLFGRDDD